MEHWDRAKAAMPAQPFPISVGTPRGALWAEIPQQTLTCPCGGGKGWMAGAASPGGSHHPQDSSEHQRSRGSAFSSQALLFPSAVWGYPALSVCSFERGTCGENPSQAQLSCLAISKGLGVMATTASLG